MPFYKIFCIAVHYPEFRHIKELVSQSARLIMDQGGVVRDIESLGTMRLPQRMRRQKSYHETGDYWSMHFDASPNLLRQLNNKLRSDPRVIRWTALKLGDRLENVIENKSMTVVRGLRGRGHDLQQLLSDDLPITPRAPAFAGVSFDGYIRPPFQ